MNIRNVIRLKICGMRDVANMLDVAALGPDYMGFIFYELSPRFVGNMSFHQGLWVNNFLYPVIFRKV